MATKERVAAADEPADRRPQRSTPVRGGGIVLPAVSVKRLMLRFILTGLASLVILAAVTAYMSRRVGTEEAVREARRISWVTGKGIIEPSITPALLRGDPQALAEMQDRVRDKVLLGSLVRVKIWAPDGRIIYSDEQRLIGERFELDSGAREALASDAGHAEISDLSSPENRYEPRGSQLLEVYTPIVTPSGQKLLFEPYFSYNAVTESGRRLWLSFAPVVLGALLLLQLLQIPSAWSLARRLRQGQEERERLMRHAIDSSDAERRRIASDLHDGTVQDLTGVSFALTAASRRAGTDAAGTRTEIDPEIITDAAGRVRGAITSLRSLLVEIYPPNLEEAGLESALTDMVARLPARGIEPHVDVELPATEPSARTSALIYRSAQEIVRNVVSHADATQLWLRVRPADGGLRLEIEDNGKGFDPEAAVEAQAEGHVGLRVLGDLVAEAGGQVELASAPGRGTVIVVQVPE
jgi:two-component system, NarL family, sensor kinase